MTLVLCAAKLSVLSAVDILMCRQCFDHEAWFVSCLCGVCRAELLEEFQPSDTLCLAMQNKQTPELTPSYMQACSSPRPAC